MYLVRIYVDFNENDTGYGAAVAYYYFSMNSCVTVVSYSGGETYACIEGGSVLTGSNAGSLSSGSYSGSGFTAYKLM